MFSSKRYSASRVKDTVFWTKRYSVSDRNIVSFTPKNTLFCPKRYNVLNRKIVSFGRFAGIRACVRIVSFCKIFQSSNFIFADFLLS